MADGDVLQRDITYEATSPGFRASMKRSSKPADRRTRKRALRIGVDVREMLSPLVTGIGRYLSNFLDGVSRQDLSHSFVLYAPDAPPIGCDARNSRFERISACPTPWWDHVALPIRLARDGIDVFFTPYDKAPLVVPCPYVATFHDVIYTRSSEFTGVRRTAYNACIIPFRRLVAHRATRLITVSCYARDGIARAFGVNRDKIHVVPNAVADRYRPVPADEATQAARHHGIRRPYLLHVGNWNPHKNVTGLIDAYALLPSGLRSVHHLVLCGYPGRFESIVRDKIRRMGLEDTIRPIGAVPDGDLPGLYSAALLFVFPSLYEGFGLPPLEAMACGTPVVVSRAASLPEVVGDAGVLVDASSPVEMARAIEHLLEQGDLRKHYAEAGMRRARQFTVERTTRQTLRILEQAAWTHRP